MNDKTRSDLVSGNTKVPAIKHTNLSLFLWNKNILLLSRLVRVFSCRVNIYKKNGLRQVAVFFFCFLAAVAGPSVLAESPASGKSKVIRIAAVGDIMMGTENNLPADEALAAFAEVTPYLKKSHVVLGNLEGPLTDQGEPTKTEVEGRAYLFRTPPHYVERLKEAGFTVLSLANNHINDYGQAGADQTRAVLADAGLAHTGAPGQIAFQRVGKTQVAVIGLAPNRGCQHLNDLEGAVKLVKQAASQDNTLVVVTFHGGAEGADKVSVPEGSEEYLGENRGDLRTLARELIDAGAHLVVGHGPHVPRGLEIYKGRLIAYSLGNFATGRGISVAGRSGLAPLLIVEMSPSGQLLGGQVVSFKQNKAGEPVLDPDKGAATLMHQLSLADFQTPALNDSGQLMISEAQALSLAASRPGEPIIGGSAQGGDAKADSTRKGGKQSAQPTGTSYEWDVHSGQGRSTDRPRSSAR